VMKVENVPAERAAVAVGALAGVRVVDVRA